MKIKKIIFSNINNLKGGPHIIDFEKEPLSSSGIFAITGPTGAGKSTILDVITLALYNRIPRHGKVSKKAIQDHGSVVTHHSNAASASVEYEVAGLRYTSTWSVEKARTGNLKDYEMSVTDATGQYVDLKKSEVPSYNARIIGLNYDQFVKSIILSQGEFSKFLKADKNERGEMLEKLTGTDIYRSISIAAYEKFKEVKENLQREKDILSEILVLSEEQVKTIRERNKNAEKLKVNTNKVVKELTQLVHIKRQSAEVDLKLREINVRIAKNEQDQKELSLDIERLKQHDEIVVFASQWTTYKEATKRNEDRITFLKRENEKLIESRKALSKQLGEMSTFVQEEVAEDSYRTVKSKFVQEIVRMDHRLQQLKDEGLQERKRIQTKALELSHQNELSSDPKTAIITLTHKRKELLSSLSKSGISENGDLKNLRDQLKLKTEKISTLQQEKAIAEQITLLEKQVASSTKDIDKNSETLKVNIALLEKEKNMQAELAEHENTLMKRKQDLLKIASLEDLRNDLVAGEPCPLCGSVEHPLYEHLEDRPSDIDKELAAISTRLTSSAAEMRKLERIISQAETARKISEKLRAENNSRISELKHKISDRAIDLKMIEAEIQKRKEKLLILENAVRALEEITIINGLVQQYENLSKSIATYKELLYSRNQKYSGIDVVKDGDRIEKTIEDARAAVNKSIEFIADREKAMQKDALKKDEVEAALIPEATKRGMKSIEELFSLLIPLEQVAKIRKKIQEVEENALKLKSERLILLQQDKENKERDFDPDQSLEKATTRLEEKELLKEKLNQEIAELRATLQQNEKSGENRKIREKAMAKLADQERKWSLLSRMIGSRNGDKFANFAQGLTLQNLLARTNRRLEGLTDRYLLNKPNADGTLSIIDRYQGNIERSVTTLSGGEVFIISLALALSLSDMASKNIALESLFIDEGFGTLDQETLDVAMTTLEKLQSENQKIVGVISHVEALKERITTQIHLKKNAQGYSKIEILS